MTLICNTDNLGLAGHFRQRDFEVSLYRGGSLVDIQTTHASFKNGFYSEERRLLVAMKADMLPYQPKNICGVDRIMVGVICGPHLLGQA